MQKKKCHFSASGIGGCSWSLLFHIKAQLWGAGDQWNYHVRPILTTFGQKQATGLDFNV